MESYYFYKEGENIRPVYGTDFFTAVRNAVLEAFYKYHEGNPKLEDKKVNPGEDYYATDKKRGDFLVDYLKTYNPDDVPFGDRPMINALKNAYDTLQRFPVFAPEERSSFKYGTGSPVASPPQSPRLPPNFFAGSEERLEEFIKEKGKRAGREGIMAAIKIRRKKGFLSLEDQALAEAAQSRDIQTIRLFPKSDYQDFFRRHCSVAGLPIVDLKNDDALYVNVGQYVNINGVRHTWNVRTKARSGYSAVQYCTAIKKAIENY